MLYANAIKRLTRAGYQVFGDVRPSLMQPGTTYEAGLTARLPGGRYRIEVRVNGRGPDVATIRVLRDGDHDDPMTDYFAGTCFESLKAAMDFVARQEPRGAGPVAYHGPADESGYRFTLTR